LKLATLCRFFLLKVFFDVFLLTIAIILQRHFYLGKIQLIIFLPVFQHHPKLTSD